MDAIKLQLERILKQLSGLTPSQKMLTAAMVAIMVMTLVWWGRYAGEPEMVPLLPQAISPDELTRVETDLEAKDIKHTVSADGKVMVPSDQRVRAVASLIYSHSLPRNAKDGFDDVLKNINPFMSQSQTEKMWNHGKELAAAQLISELTTDVVDAHVMIDPTREVHIGANIDPSATVTITMRPGVKAPQQLVDAAADVVQGALSSLTRNKIKVVVDGFPRKVRQDDGGGTGIADDLQEQIQKRELYLEDKVKSHFSYIPGLMVSVSVKLNTTRVNEHQTTYDPKNAVQKSIESMSKNTEMAANGGTSSLDAGVGANTGLSANSATSATAGGAAPSNTTEETQEKYKVLVPGSEIERMTPAGDSAAVAAAVRVPLAYFAAIYIHENPAVKDPTAKQMQNLIDEQLPKIRKDVAMCTNLKSEADIAVETYVDPAPLVVAPQTVTAGISTALLTGGHIREAILGVLALISLFMVSMVVKKGTPVVAVAVASESKPGPAPLINVAGEVAGEVGTGNTTLDAMELDDEAVHTQQMLEQVSSLVKENPDSAATLVKRWLNRS